MELDAGTAHVGHTVDTADRWPASLITLDCNTVSDGESIHLQVEGATVFSRLLQRKIRIVDRVLCFVDRPKRKLYSVVQTLSWGCTGCLAVEAAEGRTAHTNGWNVVNGGVSTIQKPHLCV